MRVPHDGHCRRPEEREPRGTVQAASAPEKDDFELNAQGQALLASIGFGYRPEVLAQLFTRIVNRMAKLWKQPVQMERYFEELLIDHRGNRKGFPLKVLMDLSTLKDYYQRSAFATARAGARQAVTNTA